MAWITPVTNRTEADVQSRNALGTLNASYLNRIEGNLQVLASELGVSISAVTTWTASDIPRVGDYQRILSNAAAVEAALPVPGGLPDLPVMPLNSYTQYNTLESIILALQNRYLVVQESRIYAGEGYYAGDTIGVI